MDQEDSFVQVKKTNEMISIKEEVIDDNCFTDSLGLKEEVASICDDEQGYRYVLNSNFGYEEIKAEPGVVVMLNNDDSNQEDKISLRLLSNGGEVECFNKSRTQSPSRNIKAQKIRKNCKLNKKGKVKISQKAKDVSKTGRISRDEILKNQEYFCSLCQQYYVGRKCFKLHFKVHFTNCRNRYVCHICNHASKTVSHINRHLLDRHFLQEQKSNVEKLFSCDGCGKSFYDNKTLQRHMYVHTRQGQIKCGECDFSCTQKARLETHMTSFHGYPRVFHQHSATPKNDTNLILKCYHCNYSTKSKGALRIHVKRHLGNKNYKCPECGYTCCVNGDFQKHLTVHSDNRPYVCDDCKKSFKRRSHLVSHFNGKDSCGLMRKKKKSSRGKKLNGDWY